MVIIVCLGIGSIAAAGWYFKRLNVEPALGHGDSTHSLTVSDSSHFAFTETPASIVDSGSTSVETVGYHETAEREGARINQFRNRTDSIFQIAMEAFNKFRYSRALSLFREAGDNGSIEAFFFIGWITYQRGDWVKKDYRTARSYFERGIKRGDTLSNFGLYCLYKDIFWTKHDSVVALNHKKRVLPYVRKKAAKDDPFFLTVLGTLSDENDAKKRLYKKAAEQGYAPAQCLLARTYLDVRDGYSEVEIELNRKAAAQGYAFAMASLADSYLNPGWLDDPSPEQAGEAMKWALKASNLGDSEGMYYLGLIYSRGYLGSPNYEEALKWYSKAANLGEGSAIFELAYYTVSESGVMDSTEVNKWRQMFDKFEHNFVP